MFSILLPHDDEGSRLLVMKTHASDCLHSGGVAAVLHNLLRRYFVLRARRLVRSVIVKRGACRKFKAVAGCEEVPCLPRFRLETSAPFATTGVDFAGPLFYKDENKKNHKGYLLLFTCMVTRAVHLELTSEMSTYELLLAFRRFYNRFRTVSQFVSDNGQTFKRAAKEFKITFGNLRKEEMNTWLNTAEIQWRCITESSPWRGGVYERMIQVVKRPLRKVLGRKKPNFRDLETILTDIEGHGEQPTAHNCRYRQRRLASPELGGPVVRLPEKTPLPDPKPKEADMSSNRKYISFDFSVTRK